MSDRPCPPLPFTDKTSGTHAMEFRSRGRRLTSAGDGRGMHGGIKVYRGSAAAARHYVEADRSRADDYYLAEGTGLADRLVVCPDGVLQRPAMDGDSYERWVAGYDVETGRPKERLRSDENAVRFVEVVVNGPKTWSLAAAGHPDIAAAYDAAQDRAAVEIMRWPAQHSDHASGAEGTTGPGPRRATAWTRSPTLSTVHERRRRSRNRCGRRRLTRARSWAPIWPQRGPKAE